MIRESFCFLNALNLYFVFVTTDRIVKMRKHLAAPLLLILFSTSVISQQKIYGLVEDADTGGPVSFATVTFEKGAGTVTDSVGKFSLSIRRQIRLNDSISISAVGYALKKVMIRDLISDHKIKLLQNDIMLEQVKVFASLKGDHRQFGYYREFKFDTSTWVDKIDSNKYRTNDRYRWSRINNKDARLKRNSKGAGEIGYIFEMPTRKFQVGKVQVKINHNYDTCWLKLHLRNVNTSGLGLPADDILKKETILPATLQYGLVEFDLDWEPITIPGKQLYVGFELQRCGCSTSEAPSFFYMGNEEGINFYRNSDKEIWKRGVDYTIYVRIITK